MWMGLLHVEGDRSQTGETIAMLSLYRDDGSRLLRIGGPPDVVPEMARVLRHASFGAPRGQPCCEHCGADLGMPDLDRACAST
jgi:hypothetical protein